MAHLTHEQRYAIGVLLQRAMKNHKNVLATLNERSSEMVKIKKINPKEAAVVEKALAEIVSEWLLYDLRTLTLDNGKEFADPGNSRKTRG